MKNIFKVLGVIALVAVIGFSMAACGGDDDSGGGGGGGGDGGGNGLTINGLSAANGLYVMASGSVTSYFLHAGKSFSGDSYGLQQISGGSVTLNVWKYNFDGEFTVYSGNDQNVSISVAIYDSPIIMVQGDSTDSRKGTGFVTVNFSNGNATGTVSTLVMK